MATIIDTITSIFKRPVYGTSNTGSTSDESGTVSTPSSSRPPLPPGGHTGGHTKTPNLPVPESKKSATISSAQAVVTSRSISMLGFNIYTKSTDPVGNCKIEVEFCAYMETSEGRTAPPLSAYNKMAEIISKEIADGKYDQTYYPRGHKENYQFSNELNFDKETLGNFTVTVLNWDDINSTQDKISSNVYLPDYIRTGLPVNGGVIKYTARVFVSTKKSNVITKRCIGLIDDVSGLFD